jgi:hypothetical protein
MHTKICPVTKAPIISALAYFKNRNGKFIVENFSI